MGVVNNNKALTGIVEYRTNTSTNATTSTLASFGCGALD
jgi:hypothetical protein